MLEEVIARLEGLGYTVQEEDALALGYLIAKEEAHITNSCNINSVPEGLLYAAIDRICGAFLYEQIQAGKIDIEAAARTITEGDTTITFASGLTPAERYTALVDELRTKEIDFVSYRRLAW